MRGINEVTSTEKNRTKAQTAMDVRPSFHASAGPTSTLPGRVKLVGAALLTMRRGKSRKGWDGVQASDQNK
jgi:hypothetical protein